MKKRWMYLLLPMAALLLELLPYGAVCNFGNPDGEPWRRTFSYFDLVPFGYANFSPLIVAVLTCILAVMIVVWLVSDISMRIPILAVSALATVLSLAPLLYGISYFSVVGACISVSLLLTTVGCIKK